MFEKEAEEYQTRKRKSFNEYERLCWGDVYKDWKNGAEFGYNKAMEEMQAQIEKTEKMQCCQNCVFMDFSQPNYCIKGVYREKQYVCDKWAFGN